MNSPILDPRKFRRIAWRALATSRSLCRRHGRDANAQQLRAFVLKAVKTVTRKSLARAAAITAADGKPR